MRGSRIGRRWTRRFAAWTPGAVLAVAACATAGPVATYEIQPTEAPLRYHLTSSSNNEIETPGGPQSTRITSDGILVVEFGGAVEGGRRLRVTIESFGGAAETALGTRELGGEGVAGKTFEAVVKPGGGVTLTLIPEIEAEGVTADDFADVVAGVVAPLPPGGDSTIGSWPHRVRTPIGSRMEGESEYEGTARLAGDTTWNGIPARVIVSRGTFATAGSGAPEGAPGEIKLALEGTGRTRYAWDPIRGVMLGFEAQSQGEGEVLAVGLKMPMKIESSSTLELVEESP